MDVHVTELEVFRTCRLYWDYQYREGLSLKETSPGGPLWIGTGVHVGLAHFYRVGRPPLEGLLAWPEYQGNSVPLMEEVLEHYSQVYQGDLEAWEVLRVETPVRVKVPGTRVYLVGTFDLLVKEGSKIWVVDHKTRTYFDSPEDLEMNEQITGYLWLCRRLGIDARGVIWNEIRKAGPRSNPRVKEYFRRTLIPRSPQELDQYESDLVLTAREMSSKKVAIYPNPSYQCSRWACPYRLLCRARRQGGDVDFIKQALFTTEKP